MLRLLLNRYHGGGEGYALLKALPEEEAQKISSISIESGNIYPALEEFRAFPSVHYSWLIASLEKINKAKLPLILALFPEEIALKLQNVLGSHPKPAQLTSLGKTFFMTQFYRHLSIEGALPLDYIPETSLSFLARVKKSELIDIIDFLALYDLAEEIQHIVDKHLLEQIYACFSQKKQFFLKKCLHQKEKLVTQRLRLEHWDGDATKLKKILHHKGIVRLGYALSGEHKDLIWHIMHILDSGRGEKLSRYCNKEAIPGVTEALRKQIFTILKFFKQMSAK